MKIIKSARWCDIDLKKQATVISILIVAPLIILASATNAIADGTHGCKIKVQNNYTYKVIVETFNGKDLLCVLFHKKITIRKRDTGTAKAHSQGAGKCTLKVLYWTDKAQLKSLCKNLNKAGICGDDGIGKYSIRVEKQGSLIINKDGSCTKS